ncbi:DUF724 domain-containing protein 3, partial [Mucuna pruriens]
KREESPLVRTRNSYSSNECVNVANVRPKLLLQLNHCFKLRDAVDAFTAIGYVGTGSHLSPDRKLELQEQPPEVETKPDNLRFRIKYSRRPLKESKFKKGKIVEVSSDKEGYKGAWFVATIVEIIGKDRFQVEYRDLKTNDGTQLLNEEIDARLIRHCPPKVPFASSFKQFQEVDAWYNDGWWEAVVLEVLNNRECLVSFIHNDVLKFENSKLRPHQGCLDGKWVMSSKKSSELVKKFGDLMPKTKNLTGIKLVLKCQKPSERDVMTRTTNTQSKFVVHLCKGAKVEVMSDEEAIKVPERQVLGEVFNP